MKLSNLTALFNLHPPLKKLFGVFNGNDFEEFLEKQFASAIQGMEEEAKHFQNDYEEKLSAHLKAALSIPGILDVVKEGYSNGRVDLTLKLISDRLPEQRLVEAKIYKCFSTHVGAINQLVSRYSTGRQSSGYVVEYVKDKDISGIVVRLRKRSDEEFPEAQQGPTCNHVLRWAYQSYHLHSSGDQMRVIHLNINLHRP